MTHDEQVCEVEDLRFAVERVERDNAAVARWNLRRRAVRAACDRAHGDGEHEPEAHPCCRAAIELIFDESEKYLALAVGDALAAFLEVRKRLSDMDADIRAEVERLSRRVVPLIREQREEVRRELSRLETIAAEVSA